jgi:hypothetical protein
MARRSRRVLLTAGLAVALHLVVGASLQAQPPSVPPSGIGVALEQAPDGRLVITRVLPGSPAANAGLAPGDVVVAVDGVAVGTMPAPEVPRRIAGPPGTRVALDLRRASGQPLRVTLVRAALSPSAPAAPVTAPTSAPAATSTAPAGVLRLRPVSIVDQQGLGLEAFRLLIPAGWSMDGGVVWPLPLSCPYPAALRVRVFDSQGTDELNIFPARPFAWSAQGIPFFPTGSFYLGSEVRPPVDALQYIRRYLVPRFRAPLSQSRPIGGQPLPDLVPAVAAEYAGVPTDISAARASFEYERQGHKMREDVYAVVVAVQLAPPLVNWIPHTSFSFTASRGDLAQRAQLFGAMMASLTPDLRWYNRYMQFVDACTRAAIDASNQALARSRIIAKTNDEISAIRRQAFQNRQAAQDRVNAKFSQYIRGVESYQHPFEQRRVELPSGCTNVWTNRSGEYLLSNSAGYNPNIGANVEWRALQK